jgi:DNA-binding CsgD family transcriptional regulator
MKGVRERLSRRDAARVHDLRDMLGRYRPAARAIADAFIHELEPLLEAEMALTMRPVAGELGWSLDFLYATRNVGPFREMMTDLGGGWSPFQPTTPKPLRNRALRPKVIHRDLILNPPSPAYREMLERVSRLGYRLHDELGMSVCDGDVLLAWFGFSRPAAFGRRELAILDALASSLRARMLLEHQVGHHVATFAMLEAALEAIPTAAFVVRGASIAHANATGRLLLDRDRAAIVADLRASVRAQAAATPFAISPVESAGMGSISLALRRPAEGSDLQARLGAFATTYRLTPRQRDVLALLVRGYSNKTIAERIGVTEATVEEHVTSLLRKTAGDSRATVVAKYWMP